MAVVDASVIVSALIPYDPNHSASQQWLNSIVGNPATVSAPTIILAEVASALTRGHANPQLATQIMNTLLGSKLITLVPVTTKLAESAAMVASQYKIRGCDAIYVALAQMLNEELITLDKQQRERAKSVVRARQP